MNQADLFDLGIGQLKGLADGRAPKYKRPPVEYVEIDKLLAQVSIKIERAIQCTSDIDRIDDLKDAIVYGIFTLGRILDERAEVGSNE